MRRFPAMLSVLLILALTASPAAAVERIALRIANYGGDPNLCKVKVTFGGLDSTISYRYDLTLNPAADSGNTAYALKTGEYTGINATRYSAFFGRSKVDYNMTEYSSGTVVLKTSGGTEIASLTAPNSCN